jgi:hypothetical protein
MRERSDSSSVDLSTWGVDNPTLGVSSGAPVAKTSPHLLQNPAMDRAAAPTFETARPGASAYAWSFYYWRFS